MTLRRFQAPSCKHFRQATYTNISNIDFYRTYDAFDKVLGPPRAPHFPTRSQLAANSHRVVCNRSSQNPKKRLRGVHILTSRRSPAPSCKPFWHMTYTDTSNLDFCRTYHAFSKVLGTPRASHFLGRRRLVRTRHPRTFKNA